MIANMLTVASSRASLCLFKHFCFLLICLLGINLSYSQTTPGPGVVWSTYYSTATGLGEGNDVATDANGNVYMAGSTSDGDVAYGGFDNTMSGGHDPILVKFNSKGERLWATYFSGASYEDVGKSVAIDKDGNVFFSGNLGVANAFLVKIKPTGELIWSRIYTVDPVITVNDIAVDQNGNIFMAGRTNSFSNIALNGHDNVLGPSEPFTDFFDAFLFKISPDGQKLWGTYYGGSQSDESNSVMIDSNGDVYIIGSTKSANDIASNGFDNTFGGYTDAFIAKFNTTGTRIWGTYFGGDGEELGNALALDTKGDFFYMGGRSIGSPDLAYNGFDDTIGNYDAILAKFTLDGQRVWSTYFGSSETPVIYDQCAALTVDSDGNVYMAGLTASGTEIAYNGFDNQYGGEYDGFVAKFSSSGDRLWATYVGGSGSDDVRSITADKNDMIYLTGRTKSDGLSFNGYDNTYADMDPYLMKITDVPLDQRRYITGYVFEDRNKNCVRDPGELPIADVVIRTEPVAYFAKTDSSGFYSLPVPAGVYDVRQLTSSADDRVLTQLCPPDVVHHVDLTNPPDSVPNVNFGNEVKLCHHLEVKVTSLQRRRCVRSNTILNFKNSGFADAEGVKIFVELPKYIRLISANAAYTNEGNGIFSFSVGQLKAGASRSIILIDSVICGNTAITGVTQCTRVWITPANNCITPKPSWDKSDVVVSSSCLEGGRAKIVIRNRGAGHMTDSSRFRIFLDNELSLQGNFRLTQSDSLVMRIPLNGRSLYVQADQHKDHPTKRSASASMEGCASGNDVVSLGFISLFCQDDEEPETDIECLAITDSFDPNDKQVSPAGIGVDHYVATQTPLEFTIRFQNKGTASANNITITDTLDLNLDIATLLIEGSSHHNDVTVTGKDIPVITWTFKDINLPDDKSDEAASHGYVKFSIRPKTTLAEKTIIRNAADILFDFNDPVRTNFTTSSIYDIPWVASAGELNKKDAVILKPAIQDVHADGTDSKILVISGQHFDPVLSENTVTFNGGAVQLLSGSETQLRGKVLSPITLGTVRVTTIAGWDERDLIVTGLEERASTYLKVYPNPSNGNFIVELAQDINSISNVSLFNLVGQTIPLSYSADGRRLEVKAQKTQPGIYFLKLETNKGTVSKKLAFRE